VRREVIEIDAPGPRKGLARLAGGRPLEWDRLPPLPPDVGKWSAHRLDLAAAYDLALEAFDLLHPQEPEPGVTPETPAQRLATALGIDPRADLLEHLGDQVVLYHSQTEAALALGQVVAVEVKDADRVVRALDLVAQTFVGGTITLKKRPCGDGEIREVRNRKQGFIIIPSYAVYKNWLVIGFYPQPVQGFIQRAAGSAKVWEPDDGVKAAFAALPRGCTGLAYNDPRPGATQMLSFGPLIIEATQSFSQTAVFDVGTLPSASVLTQRLTPNVTGVRDDGRTLRWDSRGGLLLPFDGLGVDPLMLFLATQILN